MSEEDSGYPSDKADKVLVRMPDGMRDRIKSEAKANNRTMNAEIVARLQQTLATNFYGEMRPMDGSDLGVRESQKDYVVDTAKVSEEALEVVKRVDERLKRIEEVIGTAHIELVAPAAKGFLEASSPPPDPDKPAEK